MSSFSAFNALFNKPSDPFDASHPEYECQYERGMRNAEEQLLECSYRYVPGASGGGGGGDAEGMSQDQARDTGVHAILEQFDTAIPRSVLPRGSTPPKEEGLGRVSSLKRMGSSLITSCVAPSVDCLDGDGGGDGRDSAMDNSLLENGENGSESPSDQQTANATSSRPPSVAAHSLASSAASTVQSTTSRSVHTQPNDEVLHMHAVRVTSPHYRQQRQNERQQPQQRNERQEHPMTDTDNRPPLVLLHGYANGALYFYRNLHGLSKHFHTIYAVDMMGWGLSSRPPFPTFDPDTNEKDDEHRKKQSVREAEDFFVQSLEAWRAANGIESMVLGGHSLGGYVSVAYTERYPERVAKLLLLSPVGVLGEPKSTSSSSSKSKTKDSSANPKNNKSELPQSPTESNVPLVAQVAKRMAKSFFDSGWTPGAVIRTVGRTQGRMGVESYVDKRLPGVQCPQERTALIEYLYNNAVLPPSGEECLNRLLLPGAYAVHPLCDRVPFLKVSEVVFLYGEKDWMDPTAGMDVERYCRRQRAEGHLDVPLVSVRAVRNSGHLLMIENWEGFNAAVVWACGGVLDPDVARRHRPASFVDNRRRKSYPYGRSLAAAGSETTEESYGSQEGVELDLTGQYIIEEEEDYIEYGKEATFTEKCTGVSIRKPNFAR